MALFVVGGVTAIETLLQSPLFLAIAGLLLALALIGVALRLTRLAAVAALALLLFIGFLHFTGTPLPEPVRQAEEAVERGVGEAREALEEHAGVAGEMVRKAAQEASEAAARAAAEAQQAAARASDRLRQEWRDIIPSEPVAK